MTQSDARFHISLSGGTFDVSGSEEFVREQMKQHEGVIEVLLDKLKQSAPGGTHPPMRSEHREETEKSDAGTGNGKEAAGRTDGDAADAYPNVFSISEDEIRIIADLPGANDSVKTVNAALLFLLAKESIGEKRADFSEIQEVCRSHGCLNASNFSKYMRGAKRELNVYGSGRSLEAELTHPGRKAAQALAQQLDAE